MIAPHTCRSEWQDRTYGPGRRVWNPRGPKHPGEARCTVCGATAAMKEPQEPRPEPKRN